MAEKGSIQKQQDKIKQQMRADIKGTQNVADQLTGITPIGTAKLQNVKKTKVKPPQPDDKKLKKFIGFMEGKYKASSIEVEIKKEI